MNIVHEAGLFQRRLGFTKAIVLREEGSAEFSNIQGLGQIRFPKNNIAASFEEVRKVMEREGLLGDEVQDWFAVRREVRSAPSWCRHMTRPSSKPLSSERLDGVNSPAAPCFDTAPAAML
jgi:hypothetical protein